MECNTSRQFRLRQTDGPTGDKQTIKQKDIRVHKEMTLPIMQQCKGRYGTT